MSTDIGAEPATKGQEMVSHKLKIRCPTWDHLESFYDVKVKEGNVLLARVPFSPAVGSKLTIALELPDSAIVVLDAKVLAVRQAPDGRRSAIRMNVIGLDDYVRSRLARAVAKGRGKADRVVPLASDSVLSQTETQPCFRTPIPAEALIDELVPRVIRPPLQEVPEEARGKYLELDSLLGGLQEKAAHDVLGVGEDSTVAEARRAYFAMTKKIHPDVLAHYRSQAILLLASEIFIYVNQAYNRLRDSAVAAGKSIAVGPALVAHTGWITNFDDIGREREGLLDTGGEVGDVDRSRFPQPRVPSDGDSVVVRFSPESKRANSAGNTASERDDLPSKIQGPVDDDTDDAARHLVNKTEAQLMANTTFDMRRHPCVSDAGTSQEIVMPHDSHDTRTKESSSGLRTRGQVLPGLIRRWFRQ